MEKPQQEAPQGFKQKKNIYTCDRCSGHIVTVDIDDGVTPFMIACEATQKCHGMMRSSMYRVFDQTLKASHEWYRPSPATGGNLSAGALDHVMKGGLLLRQSKHTGKTQALRPNFVPGDPRFMAAAIDFVVNHGGCGEAELHGDVVDKLTFLENFQESNLVDWPEFLIFCERQGLPVQRD